MHHDKAQQGAVEPAATITTQTGPWAMIPIWVLGLGLAGAELAVYVALRSFADRDGGAYPKVRAIAERAGVHQKTAEKAIGRLRDLGLLTTTRTYRPDGSIAGCIYHLTDLPPADEATAGGTRETAGGGTRHMAGGVPAQRREQEHTIEHTKKELNCAASPLRSDTADREDPPAWRAEDIAAFQAVMGASIETDGSGDWTPQGTWPVDTWYRAFRSREPNPIKWPGRYFGQLDDAEQLDEYLSAVGLRREQAAVA